MLTVTGADSGYRVYGEYNTDGTQVEVTTDMITGETTYEYMVPADSTKKEFMFQIAAVVLDPDVPGAEIIGTKSAQ